MKDTVTLNLDLTHIHEGLEDMLCEVEVELYRGSNNSDDPSELDVVSIKCVDTYSPAIEGQYVQVTEELENEVINKYGGHSNY